MLVPWDQINDESPLLMALWKFTRYFMRVLFFCYRWKMQRNAEIKDTLKLKMHSKIKDAL